MNLGIVSMKCWSVSTVKWPFQRTRLACNVTGEVFESLYAIAAWIIILSSNITIRTIACFIISGYTRARTLAFGDPSYSRIDARSRALVG